MPEKSTPIEEPSIGELLSSLHKVYEGRDKLAEFEEESSIFRELIPKLADTLRPLVLLRAFALGSTATVGD
jgi:hypothetical protein